MTGPYTRGAVGPEPTGMPFPLPPPPSESGIPLWSIFALVGVLVALVAATIFFILPSGPPAKSYPDLWDARVTKYVRIAEKERGLDFQHPVEVRFLPPKEFEQTVTTDDADLTAEERAQIEQSTGELRALGLLTGDVDLLRALNDARSGGVLAYYDFENETITVRGTKVRPAVRATLVHELTHVLQDQNFSVGAKMERLQGGEDSPATTAESVLRAIVEGDAERIEAEYRDSLTVKQRQALDRGRGRQSDQADERLDRVPAIVRTYLSSPYALGSALVAAAAADGGNAAVDALLRDPPLHDRALLRPFDALAGTGTVADLDPPRVPDGAEELSSGELGALTWYLMLAERVPVRTALRAADGWGGDAFVAYDQAGTSCVRADYTGRTRRDSRTMADALGRWAGADPSHSAHVSRKGKSVGFRSCDPGTESTVGSDSSEQAIEVAMTRSYLGVQIVRSGSSPRLASCVADRVVRIYSVADLQDPAFGADDPAVQARVHRIAAACR
jgi:hypothetical protein